MRLVRPLCLASVLTLALATLAGMALPAVAANAPAPVAGTPSGPATPAAPAPAVPLLLGPAMSQATPVLTCGPGLILGTYTAYYSDPAKTMFVCEKSCGDTDCTRFTPYFTTSQTCCPRIQ